MSLKMGPVDGHCLVAMSRNHMPICFGSMEQSVEDNQKRMPGSRCLGLFCTQGGYLLLACPSLCTTLDEVITGRERLLWLPGR